MKKERLIALVLFSILLASFLCFVVAAQTDAESTVKDILNLPVIKQLIGVVFGIWDIEDVYDVGGNWVTGAAQASTKVGAVIIYIMIWLILFVAFSDIVSLFSPFTEWVGWVIGLALAIIAAQLRWIYSMAAWMASATAAFGAIGVFISIIVSIVAATLLGFGTASLRKWAVQRKLAIQQVKGLSGRAKAVEGLKAMKDIGMEVGKHE